MVEGLRELTLIGRRADLDRTAEWVRDLADGRGRAVLVEGEPGIGKSSLLHAAAEEAEAAGCQVFWGACDELSHAFPLLPLLDALAATWSGEDHGHRASHDRVTALLRADAAPGSRIDTVAAAVERLVDLVDELCAGAPVLLVVDDLQWADPATVITFGRLARSTAQLPLLIAGTARPVPQRDDLSALRRAVEPDGSLRLTGLSDAEVGEFVVRKVGGAPGPQLLKLAADAGGNPLYLTELLDALMRGRVLLDQDGQVEPAGGLAPASLPAAIADRLEFLSTPLRAVLRAAALLGGEVAVGDLAAVSRRAVADLLPLLDEATVAGVLRADRADLAFRHPLIRKALYEEMPAAVRAAWHREAARALADRGAPPEKVARQLLAALDAGDAAGAVDEWTTEWVAGASQRLVGRAPNATIRLLRWALTGVSAGIAPHDVLITRLADALYRAGDTVAAFKTATGGLSYVTRPDLLVDLHWTLTQCRAIDGRSAESLAALDRALATPEIEPRYRARLLALTARTQRSLGRMDDAERAAGEALAAATAAGDRWASGWALGVLAIVHGMRGEDEQSLPMFDRALAVADGDPALADLRLVLQINQAAVLANVDRYDDAITAAVQARQLADDAGNIVRLAQAQSVLGELFFDVGRWDDALAEVELGSAGTRDPYVECYDHGLAATIRLHRGDEAAGRDLVDVEPYATRLGDRLVGPLALARSLDREQAERPVEALAVLMAGLSDPAEELEQTSDLLADAMRLAVTVGDQASAATVLQRAESVARDSEVPHRQAIAMHCRGLLDKDPTRLLHAAKRYREAGRPLPRAQALEAAGVALAEGGDLTAAREHFTDAFSVYTTLGAGWDLARTQATFRAYGIRRGPRVAHRRSKQGWSSLTPTEVTVVGLVAKGMSNPQIAAHLFLSRRTVQTHVSHILAKLDLHSRIDIAREAARRGMQEAEAPAPNGQ